MYVQVHCYIKFMSLLSKITYSDFDEDQMYVNAHDVSDALNWVFSLILVHKMQNFCINLFFFVNSTTWLSVLHQGSLKTICGQEPLHRFINEWFVHLKSFGRDVRLRPYVAD